MKNNRKISIYCLSYSDPASYYRIIQYARSLDTDIKIRYLCHDFIFRIYMKYSKTRYKKKIVATIGGLGYFRRIYQMMMDVFIYKPDMVFVSRTIYPKFSPIGLNFIKRIFLKAFNNRILWDFDDNIILSESDNSEFHMLAKYSNHIFVTSEYLKATIPVTFHAKTSLLPTTDRQFEDMDSNMLISIRRNTFFNEFNIIWIGTHYSIDDLENIMDEIDQAALEISLSLNKKTILTIISNVEIENRFKNISIRNIKWSRDSVYEEIKKAHLGLMPLQENKFTLGKGGFKAIQYLGASLPVILSDVGYNKNIIISGMNGFFVSRGQWKEKLIKIANDYDNWAKMSQSSRQVWEDKFSSIMTLEVIKSHINN